IQTSSMNGLFNRTRSRTTQVERTHCQLCTGLTDRLSCNDTYGFTEVHSRTTSQVTAVTLHAHATLRFTSQRRTDPDAFDTAAFDLFHVSFVDLNTCRNDDFVCSEVDDILQSCTAQDAIAHVHHDFTTLVNRSDFE